VIADIANKAILRFVGAGLKEFKICVLTITYMKFVTLAHIVMRHRIYLMKETMRFIEDTWLGLCIGRAYTRPKSKTVGITRLKKQRATITVSP
jgi:hypothetical protein